MRAPIAVIVGLGVGASSLAPIAQGQPPMGSPLRVQDAGRERVPDRWWESAAMVRVSPRGERPFPIKDTARLEAALDDLLA